MAIWTDGAAFVMATGWGIARRSGDAESVFLFPRGGLKRDETPPEIVSFVMLDGEGRRALVQRRGEPPSIWTHGERGGSLAPCKGPEVQVVAAAPQGSLVALAVEREQGRPPRAALRGAKIEGTTLVLDEEIAVPEARRLTWPKSIMKDGEGWAEAPVPDEDDDEDEPEDPPFDPRALAYAQHREGPLWWRGAVRLMPNRHGIGVSSTYSGLVGVLDPRSLQFRMVARVPSLREQFDLFVLPVESGMVVTLVANYRHTEFVYVDEQGEVRANRTMFGKQIAWGMDGPGVAWDASTVLVSQSNTSEQVYSLALPDLTAKAFSKDPGTLADIGSTFEGTTHVLARTQQHAQFPNNWQLSLWSKKGARWASRDVPTPDFRPVEPPKPAPSAVERVKGAPSLSLLADSTAWRGEAGADVVIRLKLENRGGEAKGVWVEAGGPVVSEGIVRVEAVAVSGEGERIPLTAKGTSARGEMPACTLAAGFAIPEKRGPAAGMVPPPPSTIIEIHVRAVRAGQGLLTVRVGPRGATGTAGSGMVGRSFLVQGG